MAEIVLSSGIRSNLLALQRTSDLTEITQERLATGKRVNSALDDATNFFTSSALNDRANDLNRLLDFISNAVQTIEAADNGLTALNKLVESAESTARQARQIATNRATTTGTLPFNATTALVGGGAGTPDLGAGDTLTFTVGTQTVNLTVGTNAATVGDIVAAINATDFARARLTTEGFLEVEAVDGSDLQVDFTDASAGGQTLQQLFGYTGAPQFSTTGQTFATTTALNTIVNAGDAIVLTAADGTVKTITVGADGTANDNAAGSIQGLIDEINSTNFATASLENGNLVVTSTDNTQPLQLGFTDTGATDAISDFGFLADGTRVEVGAAENADRRVLAAEFDRLRTQIDQLVADADFNGVNLLQGDDLIVTFNEDDTSTLTINGVRFDADGLGIAVSTNGFQDNAAIDLALQQLDGAINEIRRQASTFGSNLSVVKIRENFTDDIINTLEVGADALVLADINEEGANLLALQTRQQLSSTALSLAAQGDQSVLQLFG